MKTAPRQISVYDLAAGRGAQVHVKQLAKAVGTIYPNVTQDLLPAEERNLLPFVEFDTLPFDEDGTPVARSQELIRQNIQYLHEYLLGEPLPLRHEEVQATEDLFMHAFL